MARTVETLASLSAHLGHPDVALRVAASAQAAWEALGICIPVDRVLRDRWLEPLRQTLPPKEARQWWAEGRALPIDKAVALAENELPQITPPQAIPATAETTPNPLTPRQQQVAVLVAQGFTNRKIANRLVATHSDEDDQPPVFLEQPGATATGATRTFCTVAV
jgi:hypothetical protein